MVSVMYAYNSEKRLPVLEDYTRMFLLWIMHDMASTLCTSLIRGGGRKKCQGGQGPFCPLAPLSVINVVYS
jgi:hypothetical protein